MIDKNYQSLVNMIDMHSKWLKRIRDLINNYSIKSFRSYSVSSR